MSLTLECVSRRGSLQMNPARGVRSCGEWGTSIDLAGTEIASYPIVIVGLLVETRAAVAAANGGWHGRTRRRRRLRRPRSGSGG